MTEREVTALRDAIANGDEVRVGDSIRVKLPARFVIQTDAEFARMVARWRDGLSTLEDRSEVVTVTPELLEAARMPFTTNRDLGDEA